MLMQLTGFGIFESEHWEEKTWGGTFHQPLIISMVAGFIVANYTPSRLEALEAEYEGGTWSCIPTSAREDTSLTRCSEDSPQYRLPALMWAYSARRLDFLRILHDSSEA